MPVTRRLILLASASALAACATAPRQVAIADAPIPPPTVEVSTVAEPAPVPALVEQVAIPHQSFRLANGLTVVVHEDHKAPIVAVSVWYNVGSKDEPRARPASPSIRTLRQRLGASPAIFTYAADRREIITARPVERKNYFRRAKAATRALVWSPTMGYCSAR